MKKLEIKAGRSASRLGIMMGIVGILFIIGWIGTLLHMMWKSGIDPGAVFLMIFGVIFLIAVIASTTFYAKSAFAEKRPSILDIEEVTGDEKNFVGSTKNITTPDGEINFCPYCGKAVNREFSYCPACGKKKFA